MMKDSIDFGNMEIPRLFRRLLIPTVLGMLFRPHSSSRTASSSGAVSAAMRWPR